MSVENLSFSAAYAFWAVNIAFVFAFASLCFERAWNLVKFGMAIAARMPMIATTIISSMSVKPFMIFFMTGSFVRMELCTATRLSYSQGGCRTAKRGQSGTETFGDVTGSVRPHALRIDTQRAQVCVCRVVSRSHYREPGYLDSALGRAARPSRRTRDEAQRPS